MPKSKRLSVQKYHDRVAGRYDDSYDDAYWRWHDTLLWNLIKPHLPSDANAAVVDLGCGTGKWAARVAKSGYPVTCVDISPKMLDQARRKLGVADRSNEKVCFVRADLCDLGELPAGAFHLALAMGDPIGCTESPVKAMRQIRRILAPDGILVATFDNRLAAVDYYLQGGDIDALRRFLSDGVTHWLTKDAAERFPIHTFSPEDVWKLGAGSGLELLDMVGSTVLPMRQHRHLLEDAAIGRRLARMERSLHRIPSAIGRASHLLAMFRPLKHSG